MPDVPDSPSEGPGVRPSNPSTPGDPGDPGDPDAATQAMPPVGPPPGPPSAPPTGGAPQPPEPSGPTGSPWERLTTAVGARANRFAAWYRGTSRPKQVATAGAGALLALGTLLPAVGLGDELLAFAGETIFFVDDLPDVDAAAQRSRILDRDGEEIGILTGPENRVSVPLETVPEHLVTAVLATEDRDFFRHEGVSLGGIARAAVANVLSLGIEQGGSTLTQQYVKNALLTSERSFNRKITEATWAVRIEERMGKQEILQRYLDIVYLGDGTYGVGAAANYWFGKDVAELDLADSALLAGMIRAPEANNPAQEPDAAQARRDVVLDQMVEVGAVTAEEAEQAKAVDVREQLDITPLEGPDHGFFAEYVKQTLLDSDLLGDDREERARLLFGGGLEIRTTLDVDLQQHAEGVLAGSLTDPLADPMGGIVSLEPATGAVVTMAVGPKAFGLCRDEAERCSTTTVNPLAPGLGSPGRQVGSAFKPIVVAAALAAGQGTDWHTVVDSGQQIPGCGDYRPENYDGSGGVRDVPSALTESNNVFHVKLAVDTGLEDVVAMAADLGISRDLEPNCSLALGSAEVHPLEMAGAYATFANGGVRCTPFVVAAIVDRAGDVLEEVEPDCERVLDEQLAAQVTTMLRDVVEGGTASGASIGRPVAAKTGTTNDNIDAWLVGYTRELATATWVGFEIPAPMEGILGYRSISGGTLPAKLWAEFMGPALEGAEGAELPRAEVARYAMPQCPPPPQGEPAPSDPLDDATEPDGDQAPAPAPTDGGGEGGGEDGDGDEATSARAWPGAQQEPAEGEQPPGDDAAYDGFDPQAATIETDTDGDDFEEGHQPERCVMVADPSAYDRPSAEPSPSPSSSDATEEPSDGPSDEPSTPSPSPSSSEPTEQPSPEPTEESSPEPSPTASPEPSPSPTDDGGTDAGGR